MLEIGQQLRAARENAGLSLDDIQELTRIPVNELIALEEGRFDRLPGSFTVRSHIRTYAAQVGLEPTGLLRPLRTTGGSSTPSSHSVRNTHRTHVHRPSQGKETFSSPSTARHWEPTPPAQHSPPFPPPPPIREQTSPQSTGSLPVSPWYEFVEQEQEPVVHPFPDQSGHEEKAVDRGSKRSFTRRSRSVGWPIWAAACTFLLLIPLCIWAVQALPRIGSVPATEQTEPPSSNGNNGPLTDEAEAAIPEGMILIDRNDKKSEFELVNDQDLILEVKATDTCWVQIRENENGGYLKDIILEKGDIFRFPHPQSVSTDLWILLGAPDQVEVSVNGQEIKATEVIHIDKK